MVPGHTVVRPRARSVVTDQGAPLTKVMALVGTVVALCNAAVPARAATLNGRLSPAAPSEVPLFAVVRQLDLGESSAAIAAVGPGSVYLAGSLVNGKGQSTLERVDARSLQPEGRADVANLTSTAYGDGALWWATGAPLGGIPGNRPLPPQRHALLKLGPLSLKLEKTFELDRPPLAVTVTDGDLWVGTTGSLERLDPLTGSVLADVRLGFAPLSMTGSYNGGSIYVLGYTKSDRLVLGDYSASSGAELGYRARSRQRRPAGRCPRRGLGEPPGRLHAVHHGVPVPGCTATAELCCRWPEVRRQCLHNRGHTLVGRLGWARGHIVRRREHWSGQGLCRSLGRALATRSGEPSQERVPVAR